MLVNLALDKKTRLWLGRPMQPVLLLNDQKQYYEVQPINYWFLYLIHGRLCNNYYRVVCLW